MEVPDKGKKPSPATSRRSWWIRLLIPLLMNACLLAWEAIHYPSVRAALKLKPRYGRESTFRKGDFEAHVRNDYSYPEYSFIEVRSDSGGSWRAENGRFMLYEFTEEEFTDSTMKRPDISAIEIPERPSTDVWRDIDGDEAYELIVMNNRRAASNHLIIINVAASPAVQNQLEFYNSLIIPADLDGDGLWEFQTGDDGPVGQTYWKASAGWRHTPIVVLAQKDGGFALANLAFAAFYEKHLADMLTDYPEVLQLWRRGTWLQRRPNTSVDSYVRPPRELPQILMDHIYFGQGRRARELLDQLWPPENPNREVFLREFDYELRHNTRYFREIDDATPPENRWPEIEAAHPQNASE